VVLNYEALATGEFIVLRWKHNYFEVFRNNLVAKNALAVL
jgi:hypothetical protein